MASSKATTVSQYLKELPADRRKDIQAVRAVITRNLPKGYQESMNWGMISYEVPFSLFPDTYNGQPLTYLALAAQKNYNALYMMNVYGNTKVETRLRDGFKKLGKKLDMGKSCLRFKHAEDLPLAIIGEIVAPTPPETMVAMAKASRRK